MYKLDWIAQITIQYAPKVLSGVYVLIKTPLGVTAPCNFFSVLALVSGCCVPNFIILRQKLFLWGGVQWTVPQSESHSILYYRVTFALWYGPLYHLSDKKFLSEDDEIWYAASWDKGRHREKNYRALWCPGVMQLYCNIYTGQDFWRILYCSRPTVQFF